MKKVGGILLIGLGILLALSVQSQSISFINSLFRIFKSGYDFGFGYCAATLATAALAFFLIKKGIQFINTTNN